MVASGSTKALLSVIFFRVLVKDFPLQLAYPFLHAPVVLPALPSVETAELPSRNTSKRGTAECP